ARHAPVQTAARAQLLRQSLKPHPHLRVDGEHVDFARRQALAREPERFEHWKRLALRALVSLRPEDDAAPGRAATAHMRQPLNVNAARSRHRAERRELTTFQPERERVLVVLMVV